MKNCKLKCQPSMPWTKLALAGLLAAALAGCGGSDGTNGTNGANGANGTNGTNGTNAIATVDAVKLASSNWLSLKPTIDPASVTVSIPADGKPVVTFKVTDEKGLPVVGLGGQIAGTATALPANYNPQFTLAKLVPAANGQPSKWVSYLVTKPGTITAGAVATWAGTFPTSDNNGTLVDNNDGTYKYTFLRNITAVQAQVNGLTDTATNLKADLDPANLAYDAAATHRLGIIIQGSQPGTGTNTLTKVQVTNPVPLVNTFNMGFDFVPNGSAVTATRDIVVKASCASCHDNRAIGHISTSVTSPTAGIPDGTFVGRNDPRLCVTCHTDQTKYGFVEVTKTATGYDDTSANGYKRVNGQAAFTYPRMIHQTHMGDKLTKTGYNLNAHATKADGTIGCDSTSSRKGQCFNLVGLPQSPANCSTCHAGATTATGNKNITKDGDNWKNNPSIIACGACHDGINFADGTGTTVSGATTGHVGGPQADSSLCASCHRAGFADIAVLHRTTDQTPNNPVSKAGVSNFTYDLKSVAVTAGQPVIVFRINKDGAPVTAFNVPTPVVNGASGAKVISSSFEPITGFAGGPSFYVAYSVPQDGIAAPADFNAYQSVSLTNLLVASGSPKAGSITGPDAAGYFTATLTGDTVGQAVGGGCVAPAAGVAATCVNSAVLASPIVIPASAKMVTGAIIGVFTQKNQPSGNGVSPAVATYVEANPTVNPNVSAKGGLRRPAMLKKMVATGYTARRVITDASKCNSCHEQLGTDPAFHSQDRNDPTACSICHNANKTSNGWSANVNTFIHGIHGATKRTVGFTWAGVSATDNYAFVLYPGLLKDCNQCHLPNTVNLSANGGTALAPNMLWPTVGAGTYSASFKQSPYVALANNYGNVFSYTPVGATVGAYTTASGTTVAAHVAGAGGETVAADGATLVSSPIASACFACHDTSTAKGHMTTSGGAIYEARSTALSKTEGCLACHGQGTIMDVAVVHQQ